MPPVPSKKAVSASGQTPSIVHVLERWLNTTSLTVGKHSLHAMTEVAGVRAAVLDELREIVRSHYVSADVTAKRLAKLGHPKTAKLLREHVPATKTARSGDLGEILATEIAEQKLNYKVPIRRLRWKDGRNMALRGDDVVGVRRVRGGIEFLKGESKSRTALSSTVLGEAGKALDGHRGRPSRHAVLFVAERLRELGKDDLADQLENAVLKGFSGKNVEHLLLVLTGGNPRTLLNDHLTAAAKKKQVRHAVGVHIADHGDFIKLLFGGL